MQCRGECVCTQVLGGGEELGKGCPGLPGDTQPGLWLCKNWRGAVGSPLLTAPVQGAPSLQHIQNIQELPQSLQCLAHETRGHGVGSCTPPTSSRVTGAARHLSGGRGRTGRLKLSNPPVLLPWGPASHSQRLKFYVPKCLADATKHCRSSSRVGLRAICVQTHMLQAWPPRPYPVTSTVCLKVGVIESK